MRIKKKGFWVKGGRRSVPWDSLRLKKNDERRKKKDKIELLEEALSKGGPFGLRFT